MQRHRVSLAVLTLALLAAVAVGCAPAAPAPAPVLAPTKTPKPTFTPTSAVTPTRLIIPTATQPATQAPTKAPATATPEPTQAPPTSAPQPAAQFTANQTVNVRQGPGTAYPIVGQVNAGDNYKVTGKNADGTWYQFNYQGDPGWVIANLVTGAGDMDSVQVAQNIAPPPTAVPVPVVVVPPTQPPAPAAPTAPPPPPAPSTPYVYVEGSMQQAPNCGSVYMHGKVVDGGGNAINGVKVELEFFGNVVTRISGQNENPGEWGFAPLSADKFHTAIPFHVRVNDGSGTSNTVTVNFGNCDAAGQFTNIVFKKVQ